jgi:glycosyltransferase involved in cell wall biosynthesis
MYSMNPLLTGYVSTCSINYIHHGSYLAGEAVDNRITKKRKPGEKIKSIVFNPAYLLWDRTRHAAERWSASKSDALLCNSRLAKEKIFQAYGRKSKVVHYGVDIDLFKPANEHGFGDYVLSAGAVTPHKSFDFLINSLACIPSNKRPKLKIAAKHVEQGELIYLTNLAERKNVDLAVVRPETDRELVELYVQAKAFVFAARFEPFGLVALEAMACGTPVVGVEDGGYVDCIADGETGLITKRSPDEFGRALAVLLDNRDLRYRMGIASRESVLKYWTWDRCVDELEIILNSNRSN